MNLLLDTHVVLWWLADDPALTPAASTAIRAAGTEVFVSAATAWEISVKQALGKLEAPDDLEAAFVSMRERFCGPDLEPTPCGHSMPPFFCAVLKHHEQGDAPYRCH